MKNKILNYLCCPDCKGKLKLEKNRLVCTRCGKYYRIINDIPLLMQESSLNKHLREQIAYFKREADTYSAYSLAAWQKSYIRRFNNFIPLSADSVICDVATGSGYLAIELAKKGYRVLACDLNLKAILRLKRISQKLGIEENLLLFVCSAEELPIKDKVVDVFISNAILEHLPREKKAISELDRISKERAWGFVTVPIKLRYIWPFFWLVNMIHDKRIGHLRRYTKEDLERKFSRYGFNVSKVFYTGHLIKTTGVLLQMFLKINNLNSFLEKIDRYFEKVKYGCSNVGVILRRGKA